MSEEFFRTETSFQKNRDEWLQRKDSSLGRGYRAWACRQAALWDSLAIHASREFFEAQRIWKAPTVSL